MSEPVYPHVLIGDGVTTAFDFGVAVRQIVGIQSDNGETWWSGNYDPTPSGVCINPPLADGEYVTVFFHSDYV
jgi:hypothetical protein